jgi:hypothetical protein
MPYPANCKVFSFCLFFWRSVSGGVLKVKNNSPRAGELKANLEDKREAGAAGYLVRRGLRHLRQRFDNLVLGAVKIL